MVETKNNDRLKRECGNKKAEAATSARKLLMTINDHYMYKNHFIIYRSLFQS